MCGFAVVIGPEAVAAALAAPAWEDRERRVEEALARRGPDEHAWRRTDEAIVASSRLTHWEEGASTQPFTDDEGGLGVFNGELFNLTALQERVGRPGASEIEVLTVGFRQEGPSFFRAIDGQFAALLRASTDAPYVAVRDRFGICPLYLSHVEGGVALASHLESLMALADGDWGPSMAGLHGVLTTWAPTDGRTAFEGIRQVAPGELVVVDPDGRAHRQVWSPPLPRPEPRPAAGGVDLAEQLETELRQAVRARMRSITPVSCLVSGGIDSTVIAALAAQEGARTAVGLVLEGDEIVGSRQRQVARAVGLDIIQHTLTPAETVEVFERYVATRRVPLVRLGPVGMTALARRARREGVRAVLSGEGADELFAGYDSYRVLAARAGVFGPVNDLDFAAFGEPEFDAERGPRWARGYWRTLVRLAGGSATGRADLLRPVAAMLDEGLLAGDEPAAPAPTGDSSTSDALLDRRQDDLRDLLGAYLLTVQGDHAWMEESVELRPPYLAQGVARLALEHNPADFVAVGGGKQPVRGLLARLARERPALAELDFAKAAFRVDVRFVLRDPAAFDRLTRLVAACPREFVDTDAVLERAAHCRRVGTCSEAESMLFTFAASLGVLARVDEPATEPATAPVVD
ncbi:asparagine synthetase B family protein [Piscicoccus intestinalis]|uniref:asparagine synthetase B family protein n=1 Tax=Piscicoccus intestinalis TaxID=746033 RepID=UPI00083907BB|nr:asparagine synthetase B family protein [Piscicoccus intestinalis]